MDSNQKPSSEKEEEEDLDKCSCGRFKYKADAACWICENDAMDAEDDKHR